MVLVQQKKINYQEKSFGAAYHYLENANDVAFNMTQAYIDLLRSYQLLQNAKDNVVINKKSMKMYNLL